MKSNVVAKRVTLPKKVVEIVDVLIEEGDYKNLSDFLTEASRGHLNTWYPRKWNAEEATG